MDAPDRHIADVAVRFLRGDTSVVDFTYEFRAAMNLVVGPRPLHGLEVDLFYLLERWEEAGWSDRPDVVDELRVLCRRVAVA